MKKKSTCIKFHEQKISTQQVSQTKSARNMFHEQKYARKSSMDKILLTRRRNEHATSFASKTQKTQNIENCHLLVYKYILWKKG